MDLSSLDSTLPPGLAEAERDMGDKFRSAAMAMTTLYKSSLGHAKQAYQAGYSAALADVLSMVQSSIAASEDTSSTLSRLMDWAEARQTAITSLDDDDDDTLSLPRRPRAHAHAPHLAHLARPASAPLPSSSRSKLDDAPTPMPMPTSYAEMGTSPASSPLAQPRPVSRPRPRIITATSSSALALAPVGPPGAPAELADAQPAAAAAVVAGSKRALGDEMALDEPATPARRAAKRRSLGVALVAKQEDEERGRRRRGGGPGLGA
ncbi:hypothetical protein Q5752_007091 [Cryptotrichosporon argae]